MNSWGWGRDEEGGKKRKEVRTVGKGKERKLEK